MKNKTGMAAWLLGLGLLAGGPAQAALIDRGGGLIYDTVLDVTWLKDANYAQTSSYDADGLMYWAAAQTWADNLVYGGYDDWRLPSLNPADTTCSNSFDPGGGYPLQYYGYNCTGGELSHLFVTDLGNKAGESVLNTTGDTAEQIANLALFSNVQSNVYWSGTAYVPDPASLAWYFVTLDGYQGYYGKNDVFYAWAVRPGDVAAVPEPGSVLLVGLGLAGLVALRRRRSLDHGNRLRRRRKPFRKIVNIHIVMTSACKQP